MEKLDEIEGNWNGNRQKKFDKQEADRNKEKETIHKVVFTIHKSDSCGCNRIPF